MLGLQAEEEAGGEVMDVVHADDVVLGPRVAEVPVGEHHQVPDGREEGPRDQEGGGEAEQGPGPGKIDH